MEYFIWRGEIREARTVAKVMIFLIEFIGLVFCKSEAKISRNPLNGKLLNSNFTKLLSRFTSLNCSFLYMRILKVINNYGAKMWY